MRARLMEFGGLPSEYSKTLVTGIWGYCNILPEVETRLQGKRIGLSEP